MNKKKENVGYLRALFMRVESGEITFEELLNIIKQDTIKEKRKRMIVDSVIGSAIHEGMEDPYNFYYEALYYYPDEISREEYLRLCGEYQRALDRIDGKPIHPLADYENYPLKSKRAKEMYHRWFEVKFPKLYKV